MFSVSPTTVVDSPPAKPEPHPVTHGHRCSPTLPVSTTCTTPEAGGSANTSFPGYPSVDGAQLLLPPSAGHIGRDALHVIWSPIAPTPATPLAVDGLAENHHTAHLFYHHDAATDLTNVLPDAAAAAAVAVRPRTPRCAGHGRAMTAFPPLADAPAPTAAPRRTAAVDFSSPPAMGAEAPARDARDTATARALWRWVVTHPITTTATTTATIPTTDSDDKDDDDDAAALRMGDAAVAVLRCTADPHLTALALRVLATAPSTTALTPAEWAALFARAVPAQAAKSRLAATANGQGRNNGSLYVWAGEVLRAVAAILPPAPPPATDAMAVISDFLDAVARADPVAAAGADAAKSLLLCETARENASRRAFYGRAVALLQKRALSRGERTAEDASGVDADAARVCRLPLALLDALFARFSGDVAGLANAHAAADAGTTAYLHRVVLFLSACLDDDADTDAKAGTPLAAAHRHALCAAAAQAGLPRALLALARFYQQRVDWGHTDVAAELSLPIAMTCFYRGMRAALQTCDKKGCGCTARWVTALYCTESHSGRPAALAAPSQMCHTTTAATATTFFSVTTRVVEDGVAVLQAQAAGSPPGIRLTAAAAAASAGSVAAMSATTTPMPTPSAEEPAMVASLRRAHSPKLAALFHEPAERIAVAMLVRAVCALEQSAVAALEQPSLPPGVFFDAMTASGVFRQLFALLGGCHSATQAPRSLATWHEAGVAMRSLQRVPSDLLRAALPSTAPWSLSSLTSPASFAAASGFDLLCCLALAQRAAVRIVHMALTDARLSGESRGRAAVAVSRAEDANRPAFLAADDGVEARAILVRLAVHLVQFSVDCPATMGTNAESLVPCLDAVAELCRVAGATPTDEDGVAVEGHAAALRCGATKTTAQLISDEGLLGSVARLLPYSTAATRRRNVLSQAPVKEERPQPTAPLAVSAARLCGAVLCDPRLHPDCRSALLHNTPHLMPTFTRIAESKRSNFSNLSSGNSSAAAPSVPPPSQGVTCPRTGYLRSTVVAPADLTAIGAPEPTPLALPASSKSIARMQSTRSSTSGNCGDGAVDANYDLVRGEVQRILSYVAYTSAPSSPTSRRGSTSSSNTSILCSVLDASSPSTATTPTTAAMASFQALSALSSPAQAAEDMSASLSFAIPEAGEPAAGKDGGSSNGGSSGRAPVGNIRRYGRGAALRGGMS